MPASECLVLYPLLISNSVIQQYSEDSVLEGSWTWLLPNFPYSFPSSESSPNHLSVHPLLHFFSPTSCSLQTTRLAAYSPVPQPSSCHPPSTLHRYITRYSVYLEQHNHWTTLEIIRWVRPDSLLATHSLYRPTDISSLLQQSTFHFIPPLRLAFQIGQSRNDIRTVSLTCDRPTWQPSIRYSRVRDTLIPSTTEVFFSFSQPTPLLSSDIDPRWLPNVIIRDHQHWITHLIGKTQRGPRALVALCVSGL